MILILPSTSTLLNYKITTTLENRVYNFVFKYNVRMDRWVLDIRDYQDNNIVSGLPLLLGVDLLDRFSNEYLPPGKLFTINFEDQYNEGGISDLGNSLFLVYLELGTDINELIELSNI